MLLFYVCVQILQSITAQRWLHQQRIDSEIITPSLHQAINSHVPLMIVVKFSLMQTANIINCQENYSPDSQVSFFSLGAAHAEQSPPAH